MSMFTVRKAVAGIALLTGATLTMATAASADSISKAPKLSRRQLAVGSPPTALARAAIRAFRQVRT